MQTTVTMSFYYNHGTDELQEDLESSGSKTITNGPILRNLFMRRKEDRRKIMSYQFTMNSKQDGNIFGAKNWHKSLFGILRSCRCKFNRDINSFLCLFLK